MAPIEIQVLTKCPECGEKLTLEMYSITGEKVSEITDDVVVFHRYKCETHGVFELLKWTA